MIGRNDILYWITLLALGVFYDPPTAFASPVRATATIQPTEISLGEAAQLNIVIDGSATASAPNLPNIDGLEFNHVGQSTNLQFINGAMSGGITHIYQVLPNKDGVFKIPEIGVVVGGNTVKTSALTLKVNRPSSRYSLPASPSSSTQSSTQNGDSSPPPVTSSEVAMIQLNYPKRNFYVGELIPADLKVYLHQGLQISGISLPQLSGTAFTVDKLGNKPDESTETIHGVPYTVLTWNTAVAAIKPGEHPLGAQIECTVLVRDSSRRSSRLFGGGMFDDPFFDNFFGSVQQKRATLRTPDTTVKILPLPTEGRPTEFSGAIGRFDFTTEASPRDITVGDPLTLKMTITGTGNFDRIQPLELPKNQGFKTYQPSVKFEPTTETSYAGQKFFEQVIIPQNQDIKQIPELRFSFFDPENHQYITLTSPTIPLKVSPGTPSHVSQPQVTAANPAGNISVLPSIEPPKDITDLLPNKLELGKIASTMAPLIWNTWFWTAQSFPVLALVIAWGVAKRKNRMARDPEFARTISANRAIRIHLEAMDNAFKCGDPTAFFNAARGVLQERLGQYSGVKAETITLSEAENCFRHDPSLVANIQKVFETADAISYSGQPLSGETLHKWKRTVLEILKKMEISK